MPPKRVGVRSRHPCRLIRPGRTGVAVTTSNLPCTCVVHLPPPDALVDLDPNDEHGLAGGAQQGDESSEGRAGLCQKAAQQQGPLRIVEPWAFSRASYMKQSIAFPFEHFLALAVSGGARD